MPRDRLIEQICEYIDRQERDEFYYPTPIRGLSVVRIAERRPFEAVLYVPLLCLVLQGRKESTAGTRSVSFGAGDSLIVSHEVPVVSQVTEASIGEPYVSMVLELDLGIVRSLFDEISDADAPIERAKALVVGETDVRLEDAMGRLFDLVERPSEAKVLVPMLLREIHFRLLLAQHGAMLRQLLQRGSHADRIARVIRRIKADLKIHHGIPELAREAGMSPSSFHEHFKTVTGLTPLQYQKDLRLLEARRILLEGSSNVAGAAYEVGYESPNQFSREYSRKFGVTPSSDMRGGR